MLGVPLYGFSPLQLEPDERFLERFHGIDERVGVEALRWGLPVLYDVDRRPSAADPLRASRLAELGGAAAALGCRG